MLQRSPESKLSKIANRSVLPDIPSSHFDIILDFLRTNALEVPSHVSLEALKREAEMLDLVQLAQEVRLREGVVTQEKMLEAVLKQQGQIAKLTRKFTVALNYIGGAMDVVANENGLVEEESD